MALTNLKVDKAKPKEKQYKLADERGMYLLIHPKGGKWWRLDYRFQGKRKTLSLGTVPEVSLKEARKKRDEARSILEGGVDPSYYRHRPKHLAMIHSRPSLGSGMRSSGGSGLRVMPLRRLAGLRKTYSPGSDPARLMRSNPLSYCVSLDGLRIAGR